MNEDDLVGANLGEVRLLDIYVPLELTLFAFVFHDTTYLEWFL